MLSVASLWSATCVVLAAAVWQLPRTLARARALRLLRSELSVLPAVRASVSSRVQQLSGQRQRVALRRATVVVSFVEALVAEIETGQPPSLAVRNAAARFDDPVLRRVVRHLELGSDAVTSLRAASDAPGARDLWAVCVCLQVGERSGSGLADSLRPVVEGMRGEHELAREVASQLAAPRASARLIASLPVLVWVLGAGLGADPLHVLATSPIGWACLAVGIALEVAGLRWVTAMGRAVQQQ